MVVKTKCGNEIVPEQIQKYKNTLIAFREGELQPEYRTITTYRIDAEAENKLSSIRWTIALSTIIFILVVAICIFKIRQFNQSIHKTKIEITDQRRDLKGY
mmetsp:Transcript_42019/g.64364  ORF Transcript_42019/g.64364 Transcript_42019/m.64364 type:complete len:101 (+) Transcript_42019:1563-1865(+)